MKAIDQRGVAVARVHRGLFAGGYSGLVCACLLRYKTAIVNEVGGKNKKVGIICGFEETTVNFVPRADEVCIHPKTVLPFL